MAAEADELRLHGLNAILAVHARRPGAIRKVWLREDRVPALQSLLKWCAAHRVGYRLVGEDDLRRAMLTVLARTGQLAEGAGAAAFAALPALAAGLAGSKAVLVLSGGNIPIEDVRSLLIS